MAAAYKRPRQTSDGIELPRAADGRTLASRRFRSLCDAFAAEFGGQLTEVDRSLIAQAAGLTLRAEQLQTAIVRGQDVSNDELVGNILIAAMGRRNVGLPAPDVRASGPAMRVMGIGLQCALLANCLSNSASRSRLTTESAVRWKRRASTPSSV